MPEIAVIGAGGPTGHACVEKLLAQGKKVLAVVRDPDKYVGAWSSSEKLQIEAGDVTDASSLTRPLHNVKGIIFAASGKTYFSAKTVDTEVRLLLITLMHPALSTGMRKATAPLLLLTLGKTKNLTPSPHS
jgi:uncharacterized protein YbjT (DUF2867 family)